MELDPDIQHDSVRKIEKFLFSYEIKEEKSAVDSALSSIEKSKRVRLETVPAMNIPVLIAPIHTESGVFAVALMDASGQAVRSFILQGEEIKHSVLETWMQNLKEIEAQVRQMLASPFYLHLQEMRQKGEPSSLALSKVQDTPPHPVVQAQQQIGIISTLNRLQVMERVPPTAQVLNTESPQDFSQVLVLPLTAALLMGGLEVVTELAQTGTHPLGDIYQMLSHLQPIFPQVAVQDLIPLIHLMAVAPLYYHSWNEAVSHIKNREHLSDVHMVQNFAKDVIQIVTDPHFVRFTLLSRLRGVDQLALHDQDRLANMLKVVLIGAALSLLYSVEVGKVQKGQFGGIEPEELRELLLGKWHEPLEKKHKFSQQDLLSVSLIKRAREQLAVLSDEDRLVAVELMLDHVTQVRKLNHMLDPVKIFDETLHSLIFTSIDQPIVI